MKESNLEVLAKKHQLTALAQLALALLCFGISLTVSNKIIEYFSHSNPITEFWLAMQESGTSSADSQAIDQTANTPSPSSVQEERKMPQTVASSVAPQASSLDSSERLAAPRLELEVKTEPAYRSIGVDINNKLRVQQAVRQFFALEDAQSSDYFDFFAPVVERFYINGKNWTKERLTQYVLKVWNREQIRKQQIYNEPNTEFSYDEKGLTVTFLFDFREIHQHKTTDWKKLRGELKFNHQGLVYSWRCFNL